MRSWQVKIVNELSQSWHEKLKGEITLEKLAGEVALEKLA